MTNTLDIPQFEKAIEAIKKAPEVAMPLFEKAMNDSLRLLQGELKEYPASTEANRPGRMGMVTVKRKSGDIQVQRPMGYYERGRGWWYPVKGALKGATGVNVKQQTEKQAFKRFELKAPGQVSGYRLSPSSEQLGRPWTIAIEAGEDALVGQVGTNASYVDYVRGDRQPALFRKRGWRTIDEILENKAPAIIGFFEDAATEAFGKIGE